ncbi:E3 ubiquitin-protein ligase EL5-like [Phoenix dactylifera]|uniref:E3 ubiquitin-protein ligase EL5-like n=1 Tax=Phoenix dactylifera TaxID=42345 RepID=A0A8B7CIR7_PHODC|nr:E3 ubiquitin-protein ligase EL5-like [Phoenix dactylifera]XP_038987380.1 E3 ubiquitin-protein ligase EL5-like [Phoenix dactylifera]
MTISMEYCYSSRVVAGFVQNLALLVSFAVRWLLLPCYCWWSGDEEREAEDARREQHRRRRHQMAAAQAVRESLQVATYGEVEGEAAAAAMTCAVCLSEVGRKDRVWELRNCSHVFHKACLDRWLDHDEHLACPLCRAPLRPAASPPAPSAPSWAVERLLYLFGDDLLFAPPSPLDGVSHRSQATKIIHSFRCIDLKATISQSNGGFARRKVNPSFARKRQPLSLSPWDGDA